MVAPPKALARSTNGGESRKGGQHDLPQGSERPNNAKKRTSNFLDFMNVHAKICSSQNIKVKK